MNGVLGDQLWDSAANLGGGDMETATLAAYRRQFIGGGGLNPSQRRVLGLSHRAKVAHTGAFWFTQPAGTILDKGKVVHDYLA